MTGGDWRGLALGALALGVTGALFYAAFQLSQPRHGDDLCPLPEAAPLVAATLIVIDKSDPFTLPQMQAVKARILALRDGLAPLELITISIIEKDATSGAAVISPRLSLCNPGAGASVSPIYANPKLAQERYEEGFLAPLDFELLTLLTPGAAPQSPIARAIHAAIAREPKARLAKSRRLALISDLLEHDGDASAYQRSLTVEKIAARIAPDGAADWLRGAAVEIHLAPREAALAAKQADAKEVWAAFFAKAQARVDWRPL